MHGGGWFTGTLYILFNFSVNLKLLKKIRSVNLKKKCELYPNCLDKLIKMQSFKTFLFRRASCRFSQTSHLIQILGHWKVHKMRGFLIDHHWGKWGKGWSRDSNSQGAGVGRIGVAVDICR